MDAQVQQQVAQLVQAAKQGDQQAAQQIQQIQQAAQQGDQQAMELLQVIQQMIQSAKEGAKLQYIKRLRGNCPEGYEMEYFKAGGKVCGKCMKKAAKKAEEGTKISEPEYMRAFKAKCGAKVKIKKDQKGSSVKIKDEKDRVVETKNYSDGSKRVTTTMKSDNAQNEWKTDSVTTKGKVIPLKQGKNWNSANRKK